MITLMDTESIAYEEKHKKLIKKFYIDSCAENLADLFNNTWKSNNENLVEEFIKLCCVSCDKSKF